MPIIDLGDSTCYFRLDGADDRPVLVLSHSLGQDHGMWDPQTADLMRQFRVLRYDTRGHGASSAPAGDYRLDDLGRDVLALCDRLGIDRFAFCGLSLGGMIGQWIASQAPGRITALVLANTSARADAARLEARRRAVTEHGIDSIMDEVMGRFFSPGALALNGVLVQNARRTLQSTSAIGYAGCCAAIRDMDQREALAAISVPTLIIDGSVDTSLPWTGHGDVLARTIRGAAVHRLRAAHLSNLEAPRSFTAALLEFLLPPVLDPAQAGAVLRRAVLGDGHVARAHETASDFTREFQSLITRYAWGEIWARPGLDHQTRRLLVLAMTASLGRWEEYRLHVRAGFASDLEACDVKEVLLQTAVYAGVPAANTAFAIAEEERQLAAT